MADTAVYLSEDDLFAELERQVDMAGGQSAWAERHRVCRSQVCDTLSRKRKPSVGVLAGMGLIRVDRFISTRRGANA